MIRWVLISTDAVGEEEVTSGAKIDILGTAPDAVIL